ncbi:hypothetical protein [Citricoccus sp.]|uniref:hypothetical protein n=1 Tax=Citricoccus sp. TaxID=1978372 RepID=UPI0028BED9CA|nr:hypothetical protein [Citricoccus sp.]
MNDKLELTEGLETFEKAARDSGDSGELLVIEVQNLEKAVVSLKETFKGAGANAYSNFMVKVNECQGTLVEALSLINTGQADLYKAYNISEETTVDDSNAAGGDNLELSWGGTGSGGGGSMA